ncbi:hypothetical protein [Azospirillum endophyticum]
MGFVPVPVHRHPKKTDYALWLERPPAAPGVPFIMPQVRDLR